MTDNLLKKRVLFLGFGLSKDRTEGVSVNTLNLINTLKKMGIHSQIYNIGYQPGKEGIKSLITMAEEFLVYKTLLKKIISIVRKDNIKYIHDTFVFPGVSLIFLLPLRKILPDVVFIKELHNNPGFTNNLSVESVLRFFLNTKWQIIMIKKYFNRLISSNKEIARIWELEYLPPLIKSQQLFRKYSSKRQLRICFLGHPLRKKGVYEFIKLFEIIPDSVKKRLTFNFAFSDIGNKDKLEYLLKRKANEVGLSVTVLSTVKPKIFFRNNDILLLPLKDEFGSSSSLNTVLEAMEAGCLVVTTDTRFSRTIISNKINGILLDTPTAEDILTVIKKTLLIIVE